MRQPQEQKIKQHSIYLTDSQVEVISRLSDTWNRSINGTIGKMIDDMVLIMEEHRDTKQ